ncbi:S26 family signal peptidase [Achromobacter sp. F4_2707]|uniref:S26 family signal peptidase n=1 Tax=Achromobacter sp. F4_2707 TaxID=3114286 RepID=UPI0039C5B41D
MTFLLPSTSRFVGSSRLRQMWVLSLMFASLAALFAPAWLPAEPARTLRLIYNASDSAPRGFYVVRKTQPMHDDWVITRLPPDAAALAAERQYLPTNVPLLKRVAAMYGEHVCARNGRVTINGQDIARALGRDSLGRALIPWHGCRLLTEDEFFLLSDHHESSFDSRYFGPVSRMALLGVAVPIWVW